GPEVGPTFYRNGAIATDTLRIADYTVTPGGVSTSSPWVYEVSYAYDGNGRRSTPGLPALHGGGTQGWTQTDGYQASTGLLEEVRDPLDSLYVYGYDVRDRVSSVAYPNGITETRGCDLDSRLTSRGGAGFLSLSLDYEASDRIVEATGAMPNLEFK